MLSGVTRQEGLPSLSDQVTPSVRAKFCQVNVSSGVAEDRFELSCFVISNCLLRRFCISLKYNRKRQHWEIAARTTGESRRALTAKTRGLPATFSYELSDHSTILKVHFRWRGCQIACKPGWFFYPVCEGFLTSLGVNHLRVHGP